MKRFRGILAAAAAAVIVAGIATARADDQATAVLDRAITALGGAERLEKAAGFSWKNRAVVNVNGSELAFRGQATAQGLDHYRAEFEGDFNGNTFQGVSVVNGEKGWRKFGDMLMELTADDLANEKRTIYLALAAATMLPLKGEGFTARMADAQELDGKPADVLKVTGPDGKETTLFFDRDSGLLVKQVAKVIDFTGQEFLQETTYADYKDFGGVKKATRVTATRDGEPFLKEEITEFKTLDRVDPDTFAEPQ